MLLQLLLDLLSVLAKDICLSIKAVGQQSDHKGIQQVIWIADAVVI
jgi:hypothetical protein